MLVVGAVEVEDGGRGPRRIRLSQVADYSASSLHALLATNLASGATAKTDGWCGYSGAAGLTNEPHVVEKWPPISSCPGFTGSFPTSRASSREGGGVGLGRQSRAAPPAPPTPLMNSSPASTAGATNTPPSDPCLASPLPALHELDLTGSKAIRL